MNWDSFGISCAICAVTFRFANVIGFLMTSDADFIIGIALIGFVLSIYKLSKTNTEK